MLQTSFYHYKLQHNFTVKVKMKSDNPLELTMENTKRKKKNSVGHLSFKFPVKIQAED